MMRQKGFTLMELVIVIVVLGILSAVAIPNFVDMKGKAGEAGVKGVAGGLSSASALNLAACKTGGTPCHTLLATNSCQDAVDVLLTGGYAQLSSDGYTTTSANMVFSADDKATCVITNTSSGATANATVYAVVPL